MKKTTVTSIQAFRELKRTRASINLKIQAISEMNKSQLLEEMIRFQEKHFQLGYCDISMLVTGQHLFSTLERVSETNEMKLLARSYSRRLEYELSELIRTGKLPELEEVI